MYILLKLIKYIHYLLHLLMLSCFNKYLLDSFKNHTKMFGS